MTPAPVARRESALAWVAIAVSIVVIEILARSPLAFRGPGFFLYPLVLFVAYRRGLRPGMFAALAAAAYVGAFFLRFEVELGPPDGPFWRVGVVTLGILLSTLAVGHLRDRFDRLLEREREARLRLDGILTSVSDAFIALDGDWRVTYLNPAAQRMLDPVRPNAGTVLGRDVRDELPRFRESRFYTGLRRAYAERTRVQVEALAQDLGIWLEMSAHPSGEGLSVLLRDVSERRRLQDRLHGLSMIDGLTGLYNRRGFFTLAGQQCKQATRKQRRLLLVFADLDNLKRINDGHGHAAGDQALLAITEVLRHSFRDTDIVARVGGDEFAALALEVDPEAGRIVLARIEARLAERNAAGDLPFTLSVSVGTAVFEPGEACTVEDLVARADRAMYAAKRRER